MLTWRRNLRPQADDGVAGWVVRRTRTRTGADAARVRRGDRRSAINDQAHTRAQLVDELAQATVSLHLEALEEAGLIVGEIEGLRTCYCAGRERLAELYQLVGVVLDEAVEVDTAGCD